MSRAKKIKEGKKIKQGIYYKLDIDYKKWEKIAPHVKR